jgi:hypothetical protein
MSNGTKILIAIIITALLTFFLTREFAGKLETVEKKSDTTKTTTAKISIIENTFTAAQVGKIKKVLIDSLDAVYRNKLLKLQTSPRPSPNLGEGEDSSDSGFVYMSELDTNFVAKDSSGSVTDSMHVKSTVVSTEPLPERLVHLIAVQHKSYNKETETTTTINNKEIVEKKESFFDRFRIMPNVSAGVGLFTKTFDVYAGIGVSFEL